MDIKNVNTGLYNDNSLGAWSMLPALPSNKFFDDPVPLWILLKNMTVSLGSYRNNNGLFQFMVEGEPVNQKNILGWIPVILPTLPVGDNAISKYGYPDLVSGKMDELSWIAFSVFAENSSSVDIQAVDSSVVITAKQPAIDKPIVIKGDTFVDAVNKLISTAINNFTEHH